MYRRRWFSIAFAFSWGCAAAAPVQPLPEGTKALSNALESIRAEALEAHVTFLADDLLEGRGTGSRGFEIAARYVAAQFQASGLEPAGVGRSYFQPVPLRHATADSEKSSLTLWQGDEARELSFGSDYLMGGDLLREASTVKAPVVFVGFGITAPALQYDNYAGADVKGKVVAMLTGAPPSFPSSQRAHFSSGQLKQENAAEHGAIAILDILTPTDEQRRPWSRTVQSRRRGTMRWLDDTGSPSGTRREIQASLLLSRQAATTFFAGSSLSAEEVFEASETSKLGSFDLPLEVEIRQVSRHAAVESPNILGMLPGTDPELSSEIVVVTAHVDHVGVGEPVDGDAIYNGARDNAAGTAAMLEVARAFTRLPERPRRSVIFIGTAAEERGLLGADYFAHFPTVAPERIVANINMDGCTSWYPIKDVIAYGAEHSSLGTVVERAASQLGISIASDPFPEQVYFIRSDQYPFIKKGVPALFVMTGLNTTDPNLDARAMLSEYRRTRYHQPSDDLSQELDFEAGAVLARLHFLTAYLVAGDEARPTWNPGDFFGETYGRH